MGVVKQAALFVSIAAAFFSYGLVVGHYEVAPFGSVKALKQRFDAEIALDSWRYFSSSARRKDQGDIEVVMLGDSITARGDWGRALPQMKIANLGVEGDTSAGLLDRLEDVVGLKPRLVFLMIGINDARRDFPMELVQAHIELAAERLLDNGITPIVQSTLYVSSKQLNEKVKALNAMTRAWCARRSIVYIDLNDVLSADGALLPRFTDDGIHLTNEAYDLWSEVVRRHVASAQHAVR
jgi:lysophospholipase L1-like esterase